MKKLEKFMEGLLLIGFGWMCASIYWAQYTPDQPKLDCVPNYSQTGLECCPIDPE